MFYNYVLRVGLLTDQHIIVNNFKKFLCSLVVCPSTYTAL